MVTYNYAPVAEGGAARQAQSLAESLAARGRRVGVVTARFSGSPAFERLRGVEVHRIWAIPRPGRFTATFIPSLARFLIMHGRSYDIWHAHQAFYNAAVAIRIALLLNRRSVVKDASSGLYGDIARLNRIWFGNWVRKSLRRANAIVSLNAEMTNELLAAGISRNRIRRIPNGVDCSRFSPPLPSVRDETRAAMGLPSEEVVVLYAGRLAIDTGTPILLNAWQLVEERAIGRPWTLIVAGEELSGDGYRARGERDLKRARFVGQVLDVRTMLRAADVVVRPSLNEGMSNVVLEAMASGLPVVGTRTGGLQEQIADGVTGVLTPPGDPESLASALIGLLEDPQERERLGSAGRDRAEKTYSLSSVVASYEQLYEDLLTDG